MAYTFSQIDTKGHFDNRPNFEKHECFQFFTIDFLVLVKHECSIKVHD